MPRLRMRRSSLLHQLMRKHGISTLSSIIIGSYRFGPKIALRISSPERRSWAPRLRVWKAENWTRSAFTKRRFDPLERTASARTKAWRTSWLHDFTQIEGIETICNAYLQNARACYVRWGADGKVRQIDLKYPHLVPHPETLGSGPTLDTLIERLDLTTIVKLSQAVAGEIEINRLIKILMETCA